MANSTKGATCPTCGATALQYCGDGQYVCEECGAISTPEELECSTYDPYIMSEGELDEAEGLGLSVHDTMKKIVMDASFDSSLEGLFY